MGSRSRRGARWIVIAGLVAAIAASVALLWGSLAMQLRTGDAIRQRFANVLALQQAQALLVDAETGQRGFVLTDTPSYLKPYRRARAQLPETLRRLAKAGVVNPGDPLTKLTTAKLDELGRTILLASSGRRAAALAIVNSGTGKNYMDQFRAEDDRLVTVQRRDLESALRRSQRYSIHVYDALALLALSAAILSWFGLRLLLRSQSLEAEALRLREVEAAERQTALVARELSHRVKNLFSVVIAIVQLGGRGTADAKEATARIRERIQALAHAHELSLGAQPLDGFDFEALVRAILSPYVSEEAMLTMTGPPLRLPAMRATPVGLIVHELATNALKYGAWSAKRGTVSVTWSVEEDGGESAGVLRLKWREQRSEPIQPDGELGFGSKMINAAVAQLGGAILREREDHGLCIVITAPIVPPPLAAAAAA